MGGVAYTTAAVEGSASSSGLTIGEGDGDCSTTAAVEGPASFSGLIIGEGEGDGDCSGEGARGLLGCFFLN